MKGSRRTKVGGFKHNEKLHKHLQRLISERVYGDVVYGAVRHFNPMLGLGMGNPWDKVMRRFF